MTATSHCCLLAVATIAIDGRVSVARADNGDDGDTGSQVADESYPAQLSLRPLTLPQGMTQVAMRGGYWQVDNAPDIVPLSLAASVGITDWWTASAFTSFRLKPDTEWRERIGLSTRVLAYDSARVDFAPGIYVPINFDQEGDAHPFPAIALDATTHQTALPHNRTRIGAAEHWPTRQPEPQLLADNPGTPQRRSSLLLGTLPYPPQRRRTRVEFHE